MRHVILVSALLVLAAPAQAQSIADQAERAYAIFASGASQPDFLLSKHGGRVIEGIAGKWARLSGPDPQTGVESYGGDTDRICATPQAVTITTPAPLTANFVNTVPGGSFTQTYSLVAGATFAEHTDITAYLKAFAASLGASLGESLEASPLELTRQCS